jgi:hypothetical protein
MSRILTFGYTGRTMEEIVALAQEHDAIVVDVRLVPFSRAPMWRKVAFQVALTERYRWMKGFGNLNYRNPNEGVSLSDPETHMGDIRQIFPAQSIMLMCTCADSTGCHRRHAAAFIASALNLPDSVIEHLPPAASRPRAARGRSGDGSTSSGRVEGVHRGPMEPPSQRDLFGV